MRSSFLPKWQPKFFQISVLPSRTKILKIFGWHFGRNDSEFNWPLAVVSVGWFLICIKRKFSQCIQKLEKNSAVDSHASTYQSSCLNMWEESLDLQGVIIRQYVVVVSSLKCTVQHFLIVYNSIFKNDETFDILFQRLIVHTFSVLSSLHKTEKYWRKNFEDSEFEIREAI